MNKKLIVFLSFTLLNYSMICSMDFRETKIELNKLYRRLLDNKTNVEEQEHIENRIAELEHNLVVLEPMNCLLDSIRNSKFDNSKEKDSQLRILADGARFVYLHRDLYDNDKPKLKRRLKLYKMGRQVKECGWTINGGSCINGIDEIYYRLSMQLQLNDISLESEAKEEPEEIIKDVEERCEKDERLSDWSQKSCILNTLATGIQYKNLQ